MKPTVLVVDDEALARRRVARLLQQRGDVDVIGECSGGRDAVEAITERKPRLVLLDVQMPDLDGFEVLRALGDTTLPAVIFVTAYDRYALRAFEASAVDYVLKPYEPERLNQAVDRALQWIGTNSSADNDDRLRRLLKEAIAAAGDASPGHLERFVVKRGNKTTFVKADEVDWIESDGNYLRLHAGNNKHLVRGTIQECAERLDPRRFVRIHRRYIVNSGRVAEIQPWFGGDYVVQLTTGAKLRLSRTYREHFQSRMLGG